MHLEMNRTIIFLLIGLLAISTNGFGQIDPPPGKRWVVVPALTDDFEGTELNTEKWTADHDVHPILIWPGREPAVFHPDKVTLDSGRVNIEVGKLPEPVVVHEYGRDITYEYYGGCIRGFTPATVGHYYECEAKMNKTEMGGGFWLAGSRACGLRHEIDITESVGVLTDLTHSWAWDWDHIMHSNAFHHESACNPKTQESNKMHLPTKNHEQYYRYGFWWKSPRELLFYVNGEYAYSISGQTDYNQELYLQYDIEAYDWNPFPADGGKVTHGTLEERTTHLNYIYTFKLVDADDPHIVEFEPNLASNGGFERGDLSSWWYWGSLPVVVDDPEHVNSEQYACHIKGTGGLSRAFVVNPFTRYSLSFYSKVNPGSRLNLSISDGASASATYTHTEYTKKTIYFTTGDTRKVSLGYWCSNASWEGYVDDIVLEEVDAVPPEPEIIHMYDEEVTLNKEVKELTAATILPVPLTFKANLDREIHLKLYNEWDSLIGESVVPAYAGYANMITEFMLDSVPEAGATYRLYADIRPIDAQEPDTIKTDRIILSLREPSEVTIRVVNEESGDPLPGALVTLSDTGKMTDAGGDAIFYNVPLQEQNLEISKEGFFVLKNLKLKTYRDTLVVRHLSPEYFRMLYSFQDYTTSAPIRNAEVTVNGDSQLSGASGRTLFNLQKGSYELQLTHPNYLYRDTVVVFQSSDTTLRLKKTFSDFFVIVKKDNEVWAHVDVTLGDITRTTDPQGRITFPLLKVDSTYHYQVYEDSRILAEDSVEITENGLLTINISTTEVHSGYNRTAVSVYPNPVKETLHLTGDLPGSRFTIYTIYGVEAMNGSFTGAFIKVEDLSTGIYFLKTEETTIRFIKE